MAGQIGFDEGGVLEALNQSVYKDTVTTYKRNRKGEVVEETTRAYDISVATVLAALVLYYGPDALKWFRTQGLSAPGVVSGAAEGLADLLSGAANYAKDIVTPDESGNVPAIVTDPYAEGSSEFEAAMKHSQLKRVEFKLMLTISPERYETHAGGFAHCGKWRRANNLQKKLWKAKWGKTGINYNPSCWGV